MARSSEVALTPTPLPELTEVGIVFDYPQRHVILREPFGSARPELVEGLRINLTTEESQILHLHYVPVQNDINLRANGFIHGLSIYLPL